MVAAARGNGTDDVLSDTGGVFCGELLIKTNECSSNVFINNIGAVRVGDKVSLHPDYTCLSDEEPALTTGSPNVFVNGKQIGRVEDNYFGVDNNIIKTGSPNVFVNEW